MARLAIGRKLALAFVGAASAALTGFADGGFVLVGDSNAKMTYDGKAAVLRYTHSGSLKVIGSGTVDILLVGGGGGAGSCYPESVKGDGRGGAGGGAGLRGESHISSVQGGKGGGGAGTAGTDGLGGGGSGGCNGGSGVVIIRYKCRPQGFVVIAQ